MSFSGIGAAHIAQAIAVGVSGRQGGGRIVAWGDSFTQGAGASSGVTRYPAVASGLFTPPRTVVNMGIGGQSSRQIAARQGGVPITVSAAGDVVAAWERREWAFDFESSAQGWVLRQTTSGQSLTVSGGRLRPDNLSISLEGVLFHLGTPIPQGWEILVDVDLPINETGRPILCGLLTAATPAGVWNTDPPNRTLDLGLNEGLAFVAGPNTRAIGILTNTGPVTLSGFEIESVRVVATGPNVGTVITDKSVNVLMNSGAHTGTLAGTLAGVPGVMSTDAAGQWIFTRDRPGPAVPCPPGTAFVPHQAAQLRRYPAWIWAGRNNFIASEAVKADIAAMVGHLGHGRYLVAGILNGATEKIGTPEHAAITALNVDLAQIHGERFVDLRAMLIAAGHPVTDAADIADDVVPASFRSGNLHLNDAGYHHVATAMVARTMALRF
ncbi:SGNH/GDSL hydrolase family protein [Pelagibacterium lacus]|uniref:SGNH/GDSL hydrolase family protein n=1 Tax=Pelagibacterium lacus TaxID=2282655 RepID=A0A369W732_9HYPH|nr:SGNH/GDSL hydrolase family protein [Pelagibacterium lacus]RDE09150.1 SGNH/GDSL hydrolase family protein [Pelagibacterium lacus]